eukprot:4187818-Ditylum_brightwellii.AAC.1
MYLNATTIADVALANGKHLDPHMITGTTSLYSSKSIHMEINQAKPGQASWAKWKKAMQLWALGINLHDNPLHGFQVNQQSPFTSPHQTVQSHGKESGVGS